MQNEIYLYNRLNGDIQNTLGRGEVAFAVNNYSFNKGQIASFGSLKPIVRLLAATLHAEMLCEQFKFIAKEVEDGSQK